MGALHIAPDCTGAGRSGETPWPVRVAGGFFYCSLLCVPDSTGVIEYRRRDAFGKCTAFFLL